MDGWDQVRWTEARQVVALMGIEEEAQPAPGITPQAHFAAVRDGGDRDDALAFLGQALPRFEALAWACTILEEEAGRHPLPARDRRALDVALRWLGDPSDDRRRAARDAAEDARERAPERMLGMAVFCSGGSISLPDLPPVLPPAEVAGRLAATAISLAAYRSGDPVAVLDRALDLGDKVAAQGTRAFKVA